jgi:hypothetical protein
VSLAATPPEVQNLCCFVEFEFMEGAKMRYQAFCRIAIADCTIIQCSHNDGSHDAASCQQCHPNHSHSIAPI